LKVFEITDAARCRKLLNTGKRPLHVAVIVLPDIRGFAVCEGAHTYFLLHNRLGEAYNAFLPQFISGDVSKISHDLKDLQRLLLSENLPAEGFLFDTALAAYLLSSTDGSYSLERLSLSYLNYTKSRPAAILLNGRFLLPRRLLEGYLRSLPSRGRFRSVRSVSSRIEDWG
jgi:DNA polymerase-1